MSAALVLLAGLMAALTFVSARSLRWMRGRPQSVPWMASVLAVPKRYLVHVHGVVTRERAAAWMHVLAAGGFATSLLALLAVTIFGQAPSSTLGLKVGLALAFAGAGLAVLRRMRETSRYSRGFNQLLPAMLMLWSVSLGMLALRSSSPDANADTLSYVLQAVAIAATVLIFSGLSLGPGRHALFGMAHLAFHERPDRFDTRAKSTALKVLDLEQRPLGAARVHHFRWTQLLSFDACIECGKCEAACPATAAELPLNPKALIQDLARAGSAWHIPYAGRGHPDIGRTEASMTPAITSVVREETIWACTTCRACVEECPMLIEHVDAVMDMRRFRTMETGIVPGRANQMLTHLRETDNPEGADPASRLHWACDLNLRVLAPGEATDVLLWVGNGAFEPRNQQTLRSMVQLLRRAGVDFAVLGAAECDCGDLARRLGDEATFQRLAQMNIEVLRARMFQRILTVDPHVLHCLRNEYPALGGQFEVIHHSALLLELVRAGRLTTLAASGSVLTYHDPCYLARYNDEVDAPRQLLQAAGFSIVEMQRSGRRTSCCGGGGGLPATDIAGKRRIADVRMDHVRATKVSTLVVGCPGCMNMLGAVSEPRPAVRDLADVVLEAVMQ